MQNQSTLIQIRSLEYFYSFILSSHRYYRAFHANAIAYIVLIFFFGMRNVHLENGFIYGSILLVIINISIVMLIFSSFSRLMLKISLKISQKIV